MSVIEPTSAIDFGPIFELSRDIAQLNLGYLGISVAILGVLGGVFVYFNFRPVKDALDKQERIIENLRKRADELLEESKDKTTQLVEKFKVEQSEDINLALNNSRAAVLSETRQLTAELENLLSEKIETVSERKVQVVREIIMAETDSRLKELEKNLGSEIRASTKELSMETSKLKSELDKLKELTKDLGRDVKELKVYKFEKEGKMGSIIYSIELLKEDIDEKNWRVPDSLDRLFKVIEGVRLASNYVTDIEEQLIRLDADKKYADAISKIREEYRRMNSSKAPEGATNA